MQNLQEHLRDNIFEKKDNFWTFLTKISDRCPKKRPSFSKCFENANKRVLQPRPPLFQVFRSVIRCASYFYCMRSNRAKNEEKNRGVSSKFMASFRSSCCASRRRTSLAGSKKRSSLTHQPFSIPK